MNSPNGIKKEFRNLKIVISDTDMKEAKDFCREKGYHLSVFVGKAIKETIEREQHG